MKIWVIGRGYPTPENRMWGSFELEQAKLLAQAGHEVCYLALTLSFLSRKDRRGFRSFLEDGVRIYAYSHIYFPGKTGIHIKIIEDNYWQSMFKRVEKENGLPDLVHVHYPSMICSIQEIDSLKRKGVKIYATEHWSRVLTRTLKEDELERLKYYANEANCLIAVSDLLLNAIKEQTPTTVPSTIIPNVVSPVFYNKADSSSKDVFRFICVGRLVPLKQFDIVVDEFIKAFPSDDSVRLELVGSGSEIRKLKQIASNDRRIVFDGELGIDQVSSRIAYSNALVSYSKYETFAAPVAEAWACGKPTIVSNQSGICKLCNERVGKVVSSNDNEDLRNALIEVRNYMNFDYTYIRQYAGELFSYDAIIKRIESVYNEY